MQQLDVYYQHFLNMFRASLCPSSGDQDVCYCTWCAALVLLDVVGSCCGELRCRVRALWRLLFEHPAVPAQHTTCSNTRLGLLKMGIMMPETWWESIDNKHLTVASCWFSLSLHNLLTMHGHRNLKSFKLFSSIWCIYFTGPPTFLTLSISSTNLQMFIERIMFWTPVEHSNGQWNKQNQKLTAWRIRIFAMANAGLPLEVRGYPKLVVYTGRVVQRPTAARLRLLACPNPTHTHQRLLAVKKHTNKRYKTK